MQTFLRHLTAVTAAVLMLGVTGAAMATGLNNNAPHNSPRTTTTASLSRSSSTSRDPKCLPADLGIHYVGGQGATAMFINIFQFINVSRHECHLIGYPGVALYDRGGRELHVKVGRVSFTGHRPQTVRLRPGGRASFETETAAFRPMGRRCLTAYRARFTPPNDHSSLSIRHKFLICGFANVGAVRSRVSPRS